MPRYVLLEHTGAPDDPRGCHLDLLLEDGPSCRTWRLDQLPELDGASLVATPLPTHRLVWLEREAAAVSGGRGWARRLAGGRFSGVLPDAVDADATVRVQLTGLGALNLPNCIRLEIGGGRCRLCSCPETS